MFQILSEAAAAQSREAPTPPSQTQDSVPQVPAPESQPVKSGVVQASIEPAHPENQQSEDNVLGIVKEVPACLLGGIFLSPDISRRGLLKWVHPSVCPSIRRHNEMGSLWTQLLLQFLTVLFETLQAFLSWSKDVHLVLGLSCYFFINLFHFFDLVFFSGPITVRIDTLREQFLLEFSTHHFETLHTCSTWTVGVHVVLGLSSHYFLSTFSAFFD